MVLRVFHGNGLVVIFQIESNLFYTILAGLNVQI